MSILLLLLIVPIVCSHYPCPSPGFYPDPESCTSFYRCVDHKTSYLFVCPTGTRYDQFLGMCNHEQLVKCEVATTTTTTSIPTPTITTESSQTSSASEASLTQTSTVKPSTLFPMTQTNDSIITSTSTDSDKFGSNVTVSTDTNTPTQPPTGNMTGSQIQETNLTVEAEINIPDGINEPVVRPGDSTTKPTQILIETTTEEIEAPYTVSPTSIYPCSKPGYYEEVTSCTEFYVCREIGPGVLSADRIFRCPDRYLFDTKTRLCQRKHKVNCESESNLFYTFLNYIVVQLKEEELDEFFSQSLTLPRGRTGLNKDEDLPLLYNFNSIITPSLGVPNQVGVPYQFGVQHQVGLPHQLGVPHQMGEPHQVGGSHQVGFPHHEGVTHHVRVPHQAPHFVIFP